MPGADDLRAGSIGYFFPTGRKLSDMNRVEVKHGHLSVEGQHAVLEVLDEADWSDVGIFSGRLENPLAIQCLTKGFSGVLLSVKTAHRSRAFGAKASFTRYVATVCVGGINPDTTTSTIPVSLTANFHGISRWAGMTAKKEDIELDSRSLLRSVTIDLQAPPTQAQEATLRRHGLGLRVEPHWALSGDEDRRLVSAPVSVTVTSDRPRRQLDQLYVPLRQFQALTSLAFDELIVATDGHARLPTEEGSEGAPQSRPWMWCGPLMVRPRWSPEPGRTNMPLFGLSDLDGAAGVARFLELWAKMPRAVDPVFRRYGEGPSSPTVNLLEMAAAVEYYVKVCSGRAKWAADACKAKQKRYAQALTERLGDDFGEWVGDPERWAQGFWNSYNAVKHKSESDPDPDAVHLLSESARWLLAAVLLDRAAGNRCPSSAIFRSGHLSGLGSNVTKLISSTTL